MQGAGKDDDEVTPNTGVGEEEPAPAVAPIEGEDMAVLPFDSGWTNLVLVGFF